MEPITPARFIELLGISELEIDGHRHIILYDKHGNEYKKSLLGMFYREWRCYDSNSTAYSILSRLYESKPQTLYDELSEVLDDCGNTSDLYEGVKSWRNKNESELESIITKEV